jgi:hypothetical protein
MHWGWQLQPPNHAYVYFYCNEEDVPFKNTDPAWKPHCTNDQGEPTDWTAYSWNDIGWFFYSHYTVFCPEFFRAALTSLADQVETANGDIYMQTTIDYWRPIRARSLFHESYHWEYTVSDPLTWDETYQPLEIVKLACDNEVSIWLIMSSLTPQFSFLTLSVQIREEAAQNAENWALCAMAIYLQKTFHLDSSPVPAASSANIQGSRLHEGRLAAPPAAWNRPVPFNSSTFNPDINGVIMLQKVGSLTSGPGKPCTEGL